MGVFQALVASYHDPAAPAVEPLLTGGAVTRLVAADDAVVEPTELLAVTDTRTVDRTSADART
jgi:hypothetical protein